MSRKKAGGKEKKKERVCLKERKVGAADGMGRGRDRMHVMNINRRPTKRVEDL